MIKLLMKKGKNTYQSVKKTIFYKTKSEKKSLSTKICCINIHLAINPFTFNKYCILIIVHQVMLNQNKVLYSPLQSYGFPDIVHTKNPSKVK